MIRTKVSITKTVLNNDTGEIKDEIFTKTTSNGKAIKMGWNAVYPNEFDNVTAHLNSNLENKMFIHIKNKFTKRKSTINIKSSELSKEFNTTKRTVSKLVTKLVKYNFIMQLEDDSYFMNPFCFLPLFVDGYELQVEWEEIISEEKFLRRGLSLTEYELIEDGKLYIPTSTKILKY